MSERAAPCLAALAHTRPHTPPAPASPREPSRSAHVPCFALARLAPRRCAGADEADDVLRAGADAGRRRAGLGRRRRRGRNATRWLCVGVERVPLAVALVVRVPRRGERAGRRRCRRACGCRPRARREERGVFFRNLLRPSCHLCDGVLVLLRLAANGHLCCNVLHYLEMHQHRNGAWFSQAPGQLEVCSTLRGRVILSQPRGK